MMYKNILLTIILSISSISLFAQKPRMSREEFRQCQEKYIKEQTGLTQQEAQQFFPLYFELQDKKDAINRQAWAQMRKGKEENLSEAEVADMDKEKAEAEFGDVMFSLINAARLYKINPDNALERTNQKFIRRFNYVEAHTIKQGRNLSDMTLGEMDALWEEAKKQGL